MNAYKFESSKLVVDTQTGSLFARTLRIHHTCLIRQVGAECPSPK